MRKIFPFKSILQAQQRTHTLTVLAVTVMWHEVRTSASTQRFVNDRLKVMLAKAMESYLKALQK
jgi:hypothetical protein